MAIIANPKSTATTIKIVLIRPLTAKDILISMVEITKPEFLIIVGRRAYVANFKMQQSN